VGAAACAQSPREGPRLAGPACRGHGAAPDDGAAPARDLDRRGLCEAQRVGRSLWAHAQGPRPVRGFQARGADFGGLGAGARAVAEPGTLAVGPVHARWWNDADPRVDPPLQFPVLQPGDGRRTAADTADGGRARVFLLLRG